VPSLPSEMKYIAVREPGEPEAMQLATGPLPAPAANEVLIRVLAAGVNRPDVLQRQGSYPPPKDASPVIGLEVGGEVAAVGADVTALRVGDRVAALTNGGGYAEYCVAPATQCLPWPTGYDAIRAAALPETYFTVWANLFQHARLARGESVLIHGGTSGIGVTAIQLAREFGARVYATAGSDDKCAACLALGADGAINYRAVDFADRLMDLTGGAGVNVVLDIVGAPYFERNLRCLAMDGRLVQVSVMQGAKVERFDLSRVMQRRLVITGSTMRPRTTVEKAAIAQALKERVWPVLNAGRCGPLVHATFALAEAAAAHRLMESSAHIGKIMLKVAD
jgi:NADPH2:quinone reductase